MSELEFINAIIINGQVNILSGSERNCRLCSVREKCFNMRGDVSLCEVFKESGGYFSLEGKVRAIPYGISMS